MVKKILPHKFLRKIDVFRKSDISRQPDSGDEYVSSVVASQHDFSVAPVDDAESGLLIVGVLGYVVHQAVGGGMHAADRWQG